jgi:hypothetical protein
MACAALAAGYGLAQAALARPSVRERLRAEATEALAARLGPVDVGDARVDWLFRASLGPVATRPAAPGAAPAVAAERVRVRPRWPALLAGRVEAASVRVEGARLDVASLLARSGAPRGPAGSPRAASGRGGDEAAREAAWPAVWLERTVLVLPAGGRTVEIGPLAARVEASRRTGGVEVRAALRLAGGGSGTLEARRDRERFTARARLSHVAPGALPAPLRRGIAAGALALEVEAVGPGDLSRVEARGRIAAEGVVLRGARLAAEPVGPIDVAAEGTARLDVRRRRGTLAGEVSVADALRVGVEAEASLAPGIPFSIALRAREVDYRAVVAALPAALAPPEAAPRPAGTLDAALDASGPLLRPAEWTLEASLDLARLREAGRRDPAVALRGPFVHRARAARGEVRLAVGPSNPDFVPLSDLPAHVVRAITTSEDAGFFGHPGFDVAELHDAFAQAAEAGRLGRGGSTITQQLAKNLYLDGERTLARKVREAAVAVALEATLPKARILEIYVNVVEWGPGVRGIGAAARHWFGKDARELSPREAAFLASILPSPVRSHAMWARGEPSPAWYDRVDALLLKMGEQGVLSVDELERALEQPIRFARG